ncbi:MAG TPA: hypothetical protein VFG52_02020 [Xanthomonadales bacterium]|nr:hypothetical protein [Xanthomonadales bacterium]
MNHATLMFFSALIIALLGTAHLIMTFFGPKLLPRDRALREAMDQVHPVITRQTTIWRAWMGFNASHSLGAIMFGFFYGYMAEAHPGILFSSTPLLLFGLAMLLAYLVLAKVYWFISPLLGISISLVCYVLSLALSR